MKVKNLYLNILEYLYFCFNKWPSIQYKLWVSLVFWNHSNGEHCWLGNGPEDIIAFFIPLKTNQLKDMKSK